MEQLGYCRRQGDWAVVRQLFGATLVQQNGETISPYLGARPLGDEFVEEVCQDRGYPREPHQQCVGKTVEAGCTALGALFLDGSEYHGGRDLQRLQGKRRRLRWKPRRDGGLAFRRREHIAEEG